MSAASARLFHALARLFGRHAMPWADMFVVALTSAGLFGAGLATGLSIAVGSAAPSLPPAPLLVGRADTPPLDTAEPPQATAGPLTAAAPSVRSAPLEGMRPFDRAGPVVGSLPMILPTLPDGGAAPVAVFPVDPAALERFVSTGDRTLFDQLVRQALSGPASPSAAEVASLVNALEAAAIPSPGLLPGPTPIVGPQGLPPVVYDASPQTNVSPK